MPVERLAPDAILAQAGFGSCAVTDIDDDPDAPDALWCVASSNNVNTEVRVSFPTPSGNPRVGADLQEFRAQVRQFDTNQTGTPTARVELWENGVLVRAGAEVDVTGAGQVVSFTWNANELATADGSLVECKVVGTKSGGPPSARNTVDVGAVEWNADVPGTPVTRTVTTSLEALVQKQGELKTAGLDAALKALGVAQTASLDAALQKLGLTQTAGLDAALAAVLTATASLDALLKALGVTKTTNLDALLKALDVARTASLDAALQRQGLTGPASLDSFLQKRELRVADLDAMLQAEVQRQASLSGVLQAAGLTRAAALDAVLSFALQTFTVTASLDGALRKAGALTVAALDAVLAPPPRDDATLTLPEGSQPYSVPKGPRQLPVPEAGRTAKV